MKKSAEKSKKVLEEKRKMVEDDRFIAFIALHFDFDFRHVCCSVSSLLLHNFWRVRKKLNYPKEVKNILN